MKTLNKTQGQVHPPHEEAFDDLISLVLPDDSQSLPRCYAWAISINLLFLSVGLAGVPERLLARRELAPIEQQVIEQIEIAPTPPPPESLAEELDSESEPDTSEAPAVVAVTLDSPALDFSVPTVGNVIVKASAAQAPPPRPLGVARKETGPPVFNLQMTDSDGDRPAPTYPPLLESRGIAGTVVVLITVDAQGLKQDVKIKESSGNRDLDDHVRLWILKRWIRFPDGEGERSYKCAIKFQLQ